MPVPTTARLLRLQYCSACSDLLRTMYDLRDQYTGRVPPPRGGHSRVKTRVCTKEQRLGTREERSTPLRKVTLCRV